MIARAGPQEFTKRTSRRKKRLLKKSNFISFFILLFLAGCTNTGQFKDKVSPEAHEEEKEYSETYQVDETIKEEVIFNRRPVLKKYWIEKPNIIHCSKSGVSEGRLRSAIIFWENLGYQFGKVTTNVDSFDCLREPLRGEIMITIITNEISVGSNLAVTKVSFYTATSEIVSSRIFMIPGYANKRWILEHEIGHALGWKHFSREGHIMHPMYQNLGSFTLGLRISDYNSERSEMIQSIR
jgi:hypothetical protein